MCLSQKIFLTFKKIVFFSFILCQKCFHRLKCFLKFFFAHENMKKPASKVAEPAHIQLKSQFLFHKNLPPRDFSLMTLSLCNQKQLLIVWTSWYGLIIFRWSLFFTISSKYSTDFSIQWNFCVHFFKRDFLKIINLYCMH